MTKKVNAFDTVLMIRVEKFPDMCTCFPIVFSIVWSGLSNAEVGQNCLMTDHYHKLCS